MVIYGIKDLFQTTLLAYVSVFLQVMNLEANQGHRQARLRGGELTGADKEDMMPKQLSVTQGPKATAPSFPRFTWRLSGKKALS